MVIQMYRPTPIDIQWAKDQMQKINEGGTLAFPKAKLIYRVEHDRRRLVLTNVEQLRSSYSNGIHEQTIATFQRIGYNVTKQQAPIASNIFGVGKLIRDEDDPRRG